MTKPRKLHELKGIIKHCFSGQVTAKQWKNQPFYCLIIQQQSLFTKSTEVNIYAFPNLVSQEVWNILEQQSFKDQTYLFFCEKRTRGWRLKNWKRLL